MLSFTILVEDTTLPEITIGDGDTDFFFDICKLAIPPYEYEIFYQGDSERVTVFDTVDSSLSLTCEPASGGNETDFEPPSAGEDGVTEVSCDAEDFSGNMAEDTFNVNTRLVFCEP